MKSWQFLRWQLGRLAWMLLGSWLVLFGILIGLRLLTPSVPGNADGNAIVGFWAVICLVYGARHFRVGFNLGLQTGVSRRHILLATAAAWGLALVVIAGGIVLGTQIFPATPLLQAFGYHGTWQVSAQLASKMLGLGLLVVAILSGVAIALVSLILPQAWRGVLLVAWLALFPLGVFGNFGSATIAIANGRLGAFQASSALTPWLWPLLLGAGAAILIALDWLLVLRVAPQA